MPKLFFAIALFLIACSYEEQSGEVAYDINLSDSIQTVSDLPIDPDSDLDLSITVNNSHYLNYQLNFHQKENNFEIVVLSSQKFSSIQTRAPPYPSA